MKDKLQTALARYNAIMDDMNKKGRRKNNYGENNGKSKLTELMVREILKSRNSYSELANIYKVSKTTIRHIKKGRKWKWLHEILSSS